MAAKKVKLMIGGKPLREALEERVPELVDLEKRYAAEYIRTTQEVMRDAMRNYFNVHGRWPQFVYIEPLKLSVDPQVAMRVTAIATDLPVPDRVQIVIYPGQLNRILEYYEIAIA